MRRKDRGSKRGYRERERSEKVRGKKIEKNRSIRRDIEREREKREEREEAREEEVERGSVIESEREREEEKTARRIRTSKTIRGEGMTIKIRRRNPSYRSQEEGCRFHQVCP